MPVSVSFLIPVQYLGTHYAGGGTDHHPRARLVPEDPALPTVYFPIAPNALPNDGLAPGYTRVDPPGRTPVMLRSSEPLHTITLSATLVQRRYIDEDVETQLARLRALARSTSRVRLSYGSSEGGWWWITGFGWDVEDRVPYRNDILRAVARLDLVRATGGPAVNEAKSTPIRAVLHRPAGEIIPRERSPVRTHRVARGDTLARLALRYLGSADHAALIADANGIRNPRRLTLGQSLVIP